MSIHAEVTLRLIIMYAGKIVETGPTREVSKFLSSLTKALLDSIPILDPDRKWEGKAILSGLEVKELESVGCKFASRFPNAKKICYEEKPQSVNVNGRLVKCYQFKGNIHADFCS